MTARAIARLLPPGAEPSRARCASTARDVLALRGGALRAATGARSAMVFQDPRAHINPVRTIGDFLTEALRTVRRRPQRRRAQARGRGCCDEVGIDDGERRLRSTRTSCPAACCSA